MEFKFAAEKIDQLAVEEWFGKEKSLCLIVRRIQVLSGARRAPGYMRRGPSILSVETRALVQLFFREPHPFQHVSSSYIH